MNAPSSRPQPVTKGGMSGDELRSLIFLGTSGFDFFFSRSIAISFAGTCTMTRVNNVGTKGAYALWLIESVRVRVSKTNDGNKKRKREKSRVESVDMKNKRKVCRLLK